MLSETTVSTILTAGITGAGVVLAIYTLVTPTLEKIIKMRRELLGGAISEFYELRQKIDDKSSNKDSKQLSKQLDKIKELRAFPRYLSSGVLLSFFCFCLSILFALEWLVAPKENNFQIELSLLVWFAAGLMSFVAIGGFTIIDITNSMKEEWKKLEKEEGEAGKMTDEKLSQMEKDLEMLKRRGVNPP